MMVLAQKMKVDVHVFPNYILFVRLTVSGSNAKKLGFSKN